MFSTYSRITVVIRPFSIVALFVFMSVSSHVAVAGQACEERKMTVEQLSSAMRLAQKTELVLNQLPRQENEARMAVIARVGADVSEHGLKYTHMGLAYQLNRSAKWRVVHLLNHCGKSDSGVFTEGLANFLFDDPYEYRVMISPVRPALVSRLIPGLERRALLSVHDQDYSMIANPSRDKYQNSNQWLLEWMTVMIRAVPRTRQYAQRELQALNYVPSVINIPTAERIGARLFRANVSFDDHTLAARAVGRFKIVSVESAIVFMQNQGWLAESQEVEGSTL